MKRVLFVIGVAGLLISGVAVPAGAGDVASYIVTLDGASEVPGPGDPDGSGTVTLQLGTVSNDVCVSEITLNDIDEPLAMHIHEGGAGVEGGIVVDLTAALSAVPSCATVSAALMAELITRPECYYVNVHTEPFPAGAIRGQLVDGPCDDEPPTTVTTQQVTPTTAATATAARPTFTG
jgi:hypothetical protein